MQDHEFWRRHYVGLAEAGPGWLDLSNARVQHQGFAVCLEAADDLSEATCLDVGCGHGRLAQLARAAGAKRVIGLDFVPGLIEGNARRDPTIEWRCGDVQDDEVIASLPPCDVVFLVEMLQYVDTPALVRRLWPRVGPGGRVVGLVPNRDCPIVGRTMRHFGERYHAVDGTALADLAGSLDNLATWALRGLSFAGDQRITPYQVTPWSTDRRLADLPNRLNFVLLKANAAS